MLFGGSFPVRHEWLLHGVDYVRAREVDDAAKDLVLGGAARRLFDLH